MSILHEILTKTGRAFGDLPLSEIARRKDMNDETRHVGARVGIDVDDSGGLLLPEIINEAGGEFLGVFDCLFARSSVRNGHQQAMFGWHLHASDHSFQLLSFQTHSLIDPETSGRHEGTRHRRPAGRHGRTLLRRQRVTRQILVAGNKVHLNKGVVVL